MTVDQVKEVLDCVPSWPHERQADVADVVTTTEEQDKSGPRLTDEQWAEVRRRRARKDPSYVSIDEARDRFRELGA